MKILLDPIYTNDPGHCASNVKMKKIAEHLLKVRDDVYFYWLVPPFGPGESQSPFYPHAEGRISYIPYPYSKDRMREYVRVDREYERLVSFFGQLWDIDIVITNRSSMVPFIKAMMNKPMRDTIHPLKKVFLIEDMPIMEFKRTVAASHPRSQEIQTLAGYLTADRTAISAFWEKPVILKQASAHLSPAALNYIDKTMVESSPVWVDKLEVKKKATIQAMLDGKRPFTIAFIGRMTHGNRAEDIFDIIGKHWIMNKPGKVRGLISTQSQATGRVKVPQWMELKQLPREGFWDLVRNEIDCFVFLSPEEDYSMSLMEPLLLGCPAILLKCRWSVPTVGHDYPFFVNDTMEAAGMLRALHTEYPSAYKAFVHWQQGAFAQLMKTRNAFYLPHLIEQWLADWQADFTAWKKSDPKAPHNDIVQLIAQKVAGEKRKGFQIHVEIDSLADAGKLKHLAQKLHPEFAERVKTVWQTDWNYFRLAFMCLGWKDGHVEPGTMVKA